MKKALCFLLIFAVLPGILAGCKEPTSQSTDTTPTSITENPKTDFHYELSKDGDAVYITKYIGTAKDVVIPTQIDGLPVTSLKSSSNNSEIIGAFENSTIQSVVIPESVVSIGPNAFWNCKELTTVTVSKNLQTIASFAFTNCTKLKTIDLSKTQVAILWEGCFSNCTDLTEIHFPANLDRIDARAFYNCSSLTELHFPDSLTRIDEQAFENCTSLKSVTIPTELSLFSISKQVFVNIPALEKLIFKEGRESIDGYAFFDTTSNVEIYIPKSVTSFTPETFFIRGSAKVIFAGDCPKNKGNPTFYGDPTIYYDPSTAGWDTCPWKEHHPMKPITEIA